VKGPLDYYVIWGMLSRRLLELQQQSLTTCGTAKDHDTIMRAQGMMAAFGTAFNEMQEILREARGEGPSEG
jgi:hypothetical protein